MSESSGNQIWQIISALIGLVAVVVSVFLYYVQKNKKSLSCRLSTETKLFPHVNGKFQTTYEGRLVQDVSLIIISVLNDGNVPIEASHFEQELTFSFGTNAHVLDVGLIDVSPPGLKPILRTAQSSVVIQRMLLNNKDGFVIKVLCDRYDGNIGVDTRIVGVSEVKLQKPLTRNELYSTADMYGMITGLLMCIMILVLLFLLLVNSYLLGHGRGALLLFVILSLVPFSGIGYLAIKKKLFRYRM
jgi:hypothetical protein